MFLVVHTLPVSAQEGEYGIRLRRDFGYGAGSNVRGTFTISLSGDESQVTSVAFLIDGEVDGFGGGGALQLPISH
jgi:hypothetical protein